MTNELSRPLNFANMFHAVTHEVGRPILNGEDLVNRLGERIELEIGEDVRRDAISHGQDPEEQLNKVGIRYREVVSQQPDVIEHGSLCEKQNKLVKEIEPVLPELKAGTEIKKLEGMREVLDEKVETVKHKAEEAPKHGSTKKKVVGFDDDDDPGLQP